MGARDHKMYWKGKREFWKATTADDIIGTAGADTGQNAGGPLVVIQAGAGTLGVVTVEAEGDEIEFLRPLFWDMDRAQKVLARVIFVHRSTDADIISWKVTTKFHAKQATVVDLATSADKTTTFADHTVSTTAESLEVTDWTDLSWEDYLTADDVMVGIILECDDYGNASTLELEIIGIEFMYEVEKMDEVRRKMDHELNRNPT